MQYLNPFDYVIIIGYFVFLLVLGMVLKKMASASVEDYFLGGRRLPWWALGISGMGNFLDVTGTMIITSFLYMLGPRGLFIEFRGGAVLVLAILLLWTGRWHRRSGCVTGAEWMVFRFGDGTGGRLAELINVASSSLWTISILGYLVIGTGLFFSMYLPFSPLTCSLVIIGVTMTYTMVSGFYGVVITDMFQAVLIMVAVITVSVLGFLKVEDSASLAAVASQVTGNSDWISSIPRWNTHMPKGYEEFRFLLVFMFFYLIRNIFGSMGAGADPKYFGARNERECGTLTFFWTWLMMFRWPMMMGFAVLGIYLVQDLFPNQAVLAQAADLIQQHAPGVTKAQWRELISNIINNQKDYSSLIPGLQSILGSDWNQKLFLVSFEGTVDPERILPAVMLYCIPMGMRGLMVVAMLSALMSTFSPCVNTPTGLLTRNLYHRYIRPQAKTKELIYISWFFIFLLVLLGFLFAYTLKSINDIWEWIIMGLMAGLMVPDILRFYWWRLNGSGYAIGIATGLTAAIVQRIVYPELKGPWLFSFMAVMGLAGTIIGTYLTQPTDRKVLEHFYRTTRPFGFWGPLKKILPDDIRRDMERENRNSILAVPFTLLWQVTLFILPMQLVIHAYPSFGITLVLFCVGLTGMYFLWYKNLPKKDS